jgi:hypothetical protein
MSSRKIVIKKQASPFTGFKVVKVTAPRPGDVELVGKLMDEAEVKKFVESASINTLIEIVE